QRGLDGDGRVQAGEDVRECDAHLLRTRTRRLLFGAGDAHQPAHRLDQEVVAGTVGIGTALAEAADRAVHQSRRDGAQACRIQTVLLQPAGLEVLEDDVGLPGKTGDHRLPFGGGDVDRDRTLVAVRAEEVRGLSGVAAGGIAQVGRAPAARVVALPGALDL